MWSDTAHESHQGRIAAAATPEEKKNKDVGIEVGKSRSQHRHEYRKDPDGDWMK